MPVFLGLVFSIVITAVIVIFIRWIPTVMIWMIIGALHGLLMIGIYEFLDIFDLIIFDLIITKLLLGLSYKNCSDVVISIAIPRIILLGSISLAAIVGFVEYAKSTSESTDKGVAGLTIGILSSILLVASVAVLIRARRRICIAIALIKESNR